jgi:chitodextrinase
MPPDVAAPSIPTGLTAAAVSSSQIDLSWNASTDNVGVAGYKVYRDGIYIKSVGTTSTSDTGLGALTNYCYTVAAFDAEGNESGQSSQACATTLAPPDTTAPSMPAGLTATAVSSSQIDLSWNASTDNVGVVGYKVYKNSAYLKSVNNTSTSDTGLSYLTLYCYTISAYDAAGNESAQSSLACATTLAPPDSAPPSVPTGLTATAVSPNQIDLFWNPSTDNIMVAGYKVYRDSTFLKSVTGNFASDSPLASGTTHCYQVSAFDLGNNESALSTQVCEMTLYFDLYPADVTFLSEGADTFKVYNSGDANANNVVVIIEWYTSCPYVYDCRRRTVSVPAGSFTTLNIPFSSSDAYRIVVDPAGNIPESNVSNNCIDNQGGSWCDDAWVTSCSGGAG